MWRACANALPSTPSSSRQLLHCPAACWFRMVALNVVCHGEKYQARRWKMTKCLAVIFETCSSCFKYQPLVRLGTASFCCFSEFLWSCRFRDHFTTRSQERRPQYWDCPHWLCCQRASCLRKWGQFQDAWLKVWPGQRGSKCPSWSIRDVSGQFFVTQGSMGQEVNKSRKAFWWLVSNKDSWSRPWQIQKISLTHNPLHTSLMFGEQEAAFTYALQRFSCQWRMLSISGVFLKHKLP